MASVTSSTSRNKTRTIVKFKNGQFYLQHNSLEKDCPLVIALKAMGLEADQDIMQMIGGSGSEASLFIPSLEECSKLGVFSQDSALRYIGKAIKTSGGKQRRYRRDPREEVGEHTCATRSLTQPRFRLLSHFDITLTIMARHLSRRLLGHPGCMLLCIERNSQPLRSKTCKTNAEYCTHRASHSVQQARHLLGQMILGHIPVIRYNFRPKCMYVSLMVQRIIDAMEDKVTADDRDFMGNKRLEPAGQQIALLFEDVFKNFNMKLRESAEHSLRGNTASAFNITFHMKNSHLITHGLKTAISTGNWAVKRFKMTRTGVTAVLSRLSFISVRGKRKAVLLKIGTPVQPTALMCSRALVG